MPVLLLTYGRERRDHRLELVTSTHGPRVSYKCPALAGICVFDKLAANVSHGNRSPHGVRVAKGPLR